VIYKVHQNLRRPASIVMTNADRDLSSWFCDKVRHTSSVLSSVDVDLCRVSAFQSETLPSVETGAPSSESVLIEFSDITASITSSWAMNAGYAASCTPMSSIT
jgi:hypothetical protein